MDHFVDTSCSLGKLLVLNKCKKYNIKNTFYTGNTKLYVSSTKLNIGPFTVHTSFLRQWKRHATCASTPILINAIRRLLIGSAKPSRAGPQASLLLWFCIMLITGGVSGGGRGIEGRDMDLRGGLKCQVNNSGETAYLIEGSWNGEIFWDPPNSGGVFSSRGGPECLQGGLLIKIKYFIASYKIIF